MGEECCEEELFRTTHTKDLQNQRLSEEKGVPEKEQLDCVSLRSLGLQSNQVRITRESTATTSSSSLTCGTVGFLSTEGIVFGGWRGIVVRSASPCVCDSVVPRMRFVL